MSVKIQVGEMVGIWDYEGWHSTNKTFQDKLNLYYKVDTLEAGYEPWPAGLALEIAKRHYPEIIVIECEDCPDYVEGRIY